MIFLLRDSWTPVIQLTCLIPAVQEEIYLVKIVKHRRKSLRDILVGRHKNRGLLFQH